MQLLQQNSARLFLEFCVFYFIFISCMFFSLAGSWTTWNTTWNWKSRTVRAGKATQPANTATASTWLRSSCSATLRVLTARSNLQVKHKYLKETGSGCIAWYETYLLSSLVPLQLIVRSASWRLSQSRCCWNTWRTTTNPVKCLMPARSTARYY